MSAPNLNQLASDIIGPLSRARLDLCDEKYTQAEIAKVLTAAAVPFERECRLAPGDIVDFLCFDCIALEAKAHRARGASVIPQLKRYAASDRVKAIILATNRAMGLPAEINGKPAWYISLGRAWL